MRNLVAAIRLILTLKCEQSTRLVSESLDRDLSLLERTRGLLQRITSEGEFVFALGHEIGHVEHQHAMLNESRADVVGVVTSPFTVVGRIGHVLPVADNAVHLATGVVLTPSSLLLLSFSRSQESEADDRGVYFASELGFDPEDAVQLFEMFEEMEKKAKATHFSWLRDHPLNQDRIEDVR